jgi:hypothetical protein
VSFLFFRVYELAVKGEARGCIAGEANLLPASDIEAERHSVHDINLQLAELDDLVLLGFAADHLGDVVWSMILRDNASSDALLGSNSSILCTLLTCLSWSFAFAGSFACLTRWTPVPRPDVRVESEEIDGDLIGVWVVVIDGLDAPCTNNCTVRLLVVVQDYLVDEKSPLTELWKVQDE